MSWTKVIIFAVLIAVFTALMLIIPFAIHTSLANMGTYIESWIIFAIIIVTNCERPLEAGLKTFVFFLISQPLIYLFQVPFSYLGWHIFMFYPQWFYITLLTLPGGYIAWFIKKDNILSSVILSVATIFLIFQGCYFIPSLITNFPKNLLSILFCFVSAFSLIFIVLKNKNNRILSLIITSLSLIVFLFIF